MQRCKQSGLPGQEIASFCKIRAALTLFLFNLQLMRVTSNVSTTASAGSNSKGHDKLASAPTSTLMSQYSKQCCAYDFFCI